MKFKEVKRCLQKCWMVAKSIIVSIIYICLLCNCVQVLCTLQNTKLRTNDLMTYLLVPTVLLLILCIPLLFYTIKTNQGLINLQVYITSKSNCLLGFDRVAVILLTNPLAGTRGNYIPCYLFLFSVYFWGLGAVYGFMTIAGAMGKYPMGYNKVNSQITGAAISIGFWALFYLLYKIIFGIVYIAIFTIVMVVFFIIWVLTSLVSCVCYCCQETDIPTREELEAQYEYQQTLNEMGRLKEEQLQEQIQNQQHIEQISTQDQEQIKQVQDRAQGEWYLRQAYYEQLQSKVDGVALGDRSGMFQSVFSEWKNNFTFNKPNLPNNLEGEQCPICIDEFILGEKVIKLNCNSKHVYHKNCLKCWAIKDATCPMCRQVFDEDVYDNEIVVQKGVEQLPYMPVPQYGTMNEEESKELAYPKI